jgi:hypothetical protein
MYERPISAAATTVIAVENTARAPKRSVAAPAIGLASAIASRNGPPDPENAVRLQPSSFTIGLRKVAKT